MTDSKHALAPWIEEQLSILTKRSGHAWLLQGPSGLGQYTLSLELASEQVTPTKASTPANPRPQSVGM